MCGVRGMAVSPQKFLESRIIRHAGHPAVVVMRDAACAEHQHDGAPERQTGHDSFQMRYFHFSGSKNNINGLNGRLVFP